MIRAMTLLLALSAPLFAQAGAWDAFENRCLIPMESQFIPVSQGLELVEKSKFEARYQLPDEDIFVLELGPDDGALACHVATRASGAEAAFDQWIAKAVAEDRYLPADDADGLWYSTLWIEPVIAAEKRRDGNQLILRMLETELES